MNCSDWGYRIYGGILALMCMLGCLTLESCYSLKGISIAPGINTFYVENFTLTAFNAPATIHLDFTIDLQEKIERESRLKYNDESPDIQFSGAISKYIVTSEAVSANDASTAEFERLTIDVSVTYEDNTDEEQNWEQVFSFYRDFEANESLVDNQDQFIEDIFDQLTENIFNRAFSNW